MKATTFGMLSSGGALSNVRAVNYDRLINVLSKRSYLKTLYEDLHNGEIRSDVDIPEIGYRAETQLEDVHLTKLAARLARGRNGMDVPLQKLWECLKVVASERARNPLVERLNELKWDGTARLDSFLVTYAGCEDTPYVRAAFSRTLIAAVARAMRPGVKVDTVLILEGQQGAKKSTLFEVLGSIVHPRYTMTSKVILNNKDTLQEISTAWLVNIDEFASFRRAEMDDLKAFVSRTTDKFRAPYARLPKLFQRRFVFVATINGTENNYLDDPTGGRRWLPVEVTGTIDIPGVQAVLEQVWAEAVARFKAGEVWYIDGNDPILAMQTRREQDKRQVIDPWEDHVAAFITSQNGELFTQGQVLQALGIATKDLNQGHRNRVGKILTKLGLKVKRPRIDDGSRPYMYDSKELAANKRTHLSPVSPAQEVLDGTGPGLDSA